jgi:hypothetical protein
VGVGAVSEKFGKSGFFEGNAKLFRDLAHG